MTTNVHKADEVNEFRITYEDEETGGTAEVTIVGSGLTEEKVEDMADDLVERHELREKAKERDERDDTS